MNKYVQHYYDGYEDAVRETVEYIRDALGFDFTDSDQLLDMAGGSWERNPWKRAIENGEL